MNEAQQVEALVFHLINPATREDALLELSKKRENFPDLAPYLWHSCGAIAALLQEIVAIYPQLQPPSLSASASNRVCNALALLQCVASHHETRMPFLQAHMPLFLYPFLQNASRTRPFEYLRLTSLGVIGALVKVDDTDVINFLLSTEIVPLCLRTMEIGTELSKTVATFIVQKIMLDDAGLNYVCASGDRFFAVSNTLYSMVMLRGQGQGHEQGQGPIQSGGAVGPSQRLLKHIIRCYLRLSDNPRAREALRSCLPEHLHNPRYTACLRGDEVTRRWLIQLLMNLGFTESAAALGPIILPPQLASPSRTWMAVA